MGNTDNDKFNERFEQICKQEKRKKERKKETFNKNVKPYLVYVDDDGNIVKNLPKQKKRKQGFTSHDILVVLIFIIALVKLLYMWFGFLGIV